MTLLEARYGHSSVCVGKKVYVVGGVCSKYSDKNIGKLVSKCEQYDPDEEEWTEVAPVKKAVTFASTCKLNEEKVSWATCRLKSVVFRPRRIYAQERNQQLCADL